MIYQYNTEIMDINNCFYIGYISKTRGLKGEIQLFFEFEDYQDLEFDMIFIEIEKKLVPYFISSMKVHQNQTAYMFLDDVDHIDKTKAIIRKKVYLPLDKMPERDPEDFRMSDLKGYEVHDEEFGHIGQIQEIFEYPQHFVASVMRNEKEILLPLNEDLILEIDVDNQELFLELPEGLLDMYINE